MATANRNSSGYDPSRIKLAAGLSLDSLEETISNPGTVRINVEGAFIVEDEAPSPENNGETNGVHYEHKDIRLPHHTSVVSHVAVDVSLPYDPRTALSPHRPFTRPFLALCP